MSVAIHAGKAQTASNHSYHTYYGQKLWLLDFSSLSNPGRYNLRVPGLGISHTFLVSKDALRPVMGVLARGMYHQRDSYKLSKEFLAPWNRSEVCFMTDGIAMNGDEFKMFQEKNPLPNTKTTLPPTVPGDNSSYWVPQGNWGTARVTGGHHDAGDWGKYVVNSAYFAGWLMVGLDILETDQDNFPLPENGNAIPDILEEVVLELTYMEGMQDPTDGAVHCIVKHGIDETKQCSLPDGDPLKGQLRRLLPKDTTCTAAFAAAMARAGRSRLMKKHFPKNAAQYLQRAKDAWQFLATRAPFGALCWHHYGCSDTPIFGQYAVVPSWKWSRPEYKYSAYNCSDARGDHSHDDRIWAAAELYAATGEVEYHEYMLREHCPRYIVWNWGAFPAGYGMATFTYGELMRKAAAGAPDAQPIDQVMAERIEHGIVDAARVIMDMGTQDNPYQMIGHLRSMHVYGYGWTFPSNWGAALMVAAELAPSWVSQEEVAAWRDMAAQQLHFMLGANPQGYSLITGIGARRIINVVDQETRLDDLEAPWPGQLFGLTKGHSWLAAYGSAFGNQFPPGDQYPALSRVIDSWNMMAEMTVPDVAQAYILVAALVKHASAPLSPPPRVSVELSTNMGPAPLTVDFKLSVEGGLSQIATIEFDFGDGSHSYKASPSHTYDTQGREMTGWVTVVDLQGQAVVKEFTVRTTFASEDLDHIAAATQQLGLSLAARLELDKPCTVSEGKTCVPMLAVANNVSAGISGPSASTYFIEGKGSMDLESTNQLFQVNPVGQSLCPSGFESTITYTIPANVTAQLLAGALNGLALEAWVYIEEWENYLGVKPMLGLVYSLDGSLFGLQGISEYWQGSYHLLAGKGLQGSLVDDAQDGMKVSAMKQHLNRKAWHHLLVSAVSPGVCSAHVDGKLIGQKNCTLDSVFAPCKSKELSLVVGGFKGYVGAVNIYTSNVPKFTCAPPPPAPPPAGQINHFFPLDPDVHTIALAQLSSSCGKAGADLVDTLPMRLYRYGDATSVIEVASGLEYVAGFSASLDGEPAANAGATGDAGSVGNTAWMQAKAGCSLRVSARPTATTRPLLQWQLPVEVFDTVRASRALSLEALIYVESLRTGINLWGGNVFGLEVAWERMLKVELETWRGARAVFRTLAAPSNHITLASYGVVQAALSVGSWHHLVLSSNETVCALAVDGVTVGSQPCNVTQLLATNAKQPTSIFIGGFRGWVDQVRLSSIVRPTQVPNDQAPLPVPPGPQPPTPLPPPPQPDCPLPPLVDKDTILLLGPSSQVCDTANTNVRLDPGSPSAAAELYVNGQANMSVQAFWYAQAPTVGSTYISTKQEVPYHVSAGGCAMKFVSTCGYTCAYAQYTLNVTQLALVRAAGVFTLDAKIWVGKWVNFGIDGAPTILGWYQSLSDRFFGLYSDKDTRLGVRVAVPATIAASQGLDSSTFLEWPLLDRALPRYRWHHVALTMNTTTCTFAVNGNVLGTARCNIRSLPRWESQHFIRVGGYHGLVSELSFSAAERKSYNPEEVGKCG